MGQLVIAAAGSWLGSLLPTAWFPFLGLSGAGWGWMLGSMLGARLFAPQTRIENPALTDLKVTGTEYGQPIPYTAGISRFAGQIWWASDKRPIRHEDRQGGKGGGGGVVNVFYTYDVDLMVGLTDNPIDSVTRIWWDGKLIWVNGDPEEIALGMGLTPSSPNWADTVAELTQSITNTATSIAQNCSRLTVYTGTNTQMPDPTYETAVGSSYAPAYRGRSYVFFESLHLPSSGRIPNLTFEVNSRTPEMTLAEVSTPPPLSAWGL